MRSSSADERTHEIERILDTFQTADAADEPLVGALERRARNRRPGSRRRVEPVGIDAVVNLCDRSVGHADLTLEVIREMPRQRNVAVHERPIEPADQSITATASR